MEAIVIARELRVERARRGESQEDAACVLGVSRRTVTLWESGRLSASASVRSATAIAGYLRVPVLDVIAALGP